MNLYATISFYRSSRGSSEGSPISLADFMSMGKTYAAEIMAYRTLKQSVSEYKQRLQELDAEISYHQMMMNNPLMEDNLTEKGKLSQELQSLTRELDEVKTCIKNGEQLADEKKRGLPAATLSGYFHGKRTADNLFQHSGFMCIDIDDHYVRRDNHNKKYTVPQSIDHVPEVLASLPWVVYASHSVGGKGYFALIPIGPIDDVHTHKWYFECLEQEFLQLGLVIDPACSDVTRLRIISYDKEPYRNAKATTYMGISKFVGKAEQKRQEEEKRRKEYNERYRSMINQSDPDADVRHVAMCVEKMKSMHMNIAEAYEDWTAVGMSLANTFGENGRSFFHEISSMSTKYNFADCEKAYNGFMKRRSGSSSISSLFNIFKQNNIFWFK